MKSIKIILLLIILFSIKDLEAQQLERFTFDLAGGVAHTDQFMVHYSLGQPFTKTIDLGEIMITEGFIQGEVKEMSTAVDYYPDLTAKVFPNPTFDRISVSTSEKVPKGRIQILNVTGLLMIERPFEHTGELDISHLVPGTYFLKWVDADQRIIRQYKVVKL